MSDPRHGFFHEDDHCQIQILPLADWEFCLKQTGQIAIHDEKAADPNGMGWTSIFVLSREPTPLATLEIKRDELASALAPHLPRFEKVESGSFSYPKECARTDGFGYHGQAIYFDYDELDVVRDIWLIPYSGDEAHVVRMAEALASVAKLRELLLVDWAWSRMHRLSDPVDVGAYVRERGA